MSANNIGGQLRRFVAICQSEADPNTRLPHPLNRSPGEWQHLSELLSSLIQSCPPVRPSILAFLHPIVVAHLQAISSNQQPPMGEGVSPPKRRWQPPSALPSEAFIVNVLAESMEVCKREVGLLHNERHPSFVADVCGFALDILTPIAPPPHRDVSFASRYRRNRTQFRQHMRSGPPRSRQNVSNNNNTTKRPHSDVESTAEDVSELDETNDSGSESNRSESDSDCAINEVAFGDDVDTERVTGTSIEESDPDLEDLLPDLRPIGFNMRLLGPIWMSSVVVKQLLRIVFACLVGRLASRSCVERLVAASLPHDFRGWWRRMATPPLHSMNHKMDFAACQPHWCANWLLRQVTDAGLSSVVEPFCRRLLDVCLRGPPLGQLPYSVEYHRFWALAGLSNLVFCCVFFASSVRISLTSWMEDKLLQLRTSQPPPLIHLLGPLMVLSPRSSVFLDPGLSHSAFSRLRQLTVHPPSGNIPRWGPSSHPLPPPPQAFSAAPSALAVASGFLPHEFHLLPLHSEQVRCLMEACTEIRSTVLSTLRTFVEKVAFEEDMRALESAVEVLFRVVPSQEIVVFEELLVDSICLAPEECGCGCIELLLRLESASPSSTTIASSTIKILRLLCLRLHETSVSIPDSEVPRFFLGRALLDYNDDKEGAEFSIHPVGIGCGVVGRVFMRYFIERGSYYAGLLLLLHSCYTRNSHLAQSIFKSIILWNVDEGLYNSDKTRCPLLFFFPLLFEWMSASRGISLGPQDLLRNCLQEVLDTIINMSSESQRKTLLNLLWLVRHEQKGGDATFLQLSPSITALLPRFVSFLSSLVEEPELKSMEVILHLIESVEHQPPTRLSVSDSICVGRRLVFLLVFLMERLDQANIEFQEVVIRAFQRVERLLEVFAEAEDLVRKSALVSIAQAACDKFSATRMSFLFEQAPISLLENAEGPSSLLANPPPPLSTDLTFKTTVIKGQLIRRNPLNSRVSQNEDSYTWKPSTCLWIHLVRRLISSSASVSGINVNYQHYFGEALEDALLPHGLQLPQTNIQTCSLNSPTHQQPCGLGLERILALLRAFLPDWKRPSPCNSERVLWGFLDLLLQPPSQSSTSTQENDNNDENKRLPLPAMRLLLGLLSGLEVIWASVLAPRVPVPTFTDDAAVQIALGVFPLPGIPIVARQRALKLAIDHGHRRVDTSSRLYKATEFLVTRLAQFPYIPKNNHPSASSTSPQPPLPPPPVESLLRLLTPRETAFFLSEIRRSVRLRAYLAWRGGNGVAGGNDGVFTLNAGMLRALVQSHLVEEGLASIVPRLLQFTSPSSFSSSSSSLGSFSASGRRLLSILNRKGGDEGEDEDDEEESTEIEEDEDDEGGRIREIDVDGEVMVVLDD